MTGLPSSGKSTLAAHARARLAARGVACAILDGDAVRGALVPPPGYTDEARGAFYETLARFAALLAAQGLVVIVPATAHKAAYREQARRLAPHFIEVYVETSADECAARDAKGLYAAARAGQARDLPGVDVAYEAPSAPEIRAQGGLDEAAIARIVELASEQPGVDFDAAEAEGA